MTDCKTKKSIWIHQAGATEAAARASAEGMLQAEKLVGSDGIAYNVGGYPTYEFLMKDNAGLMKKIALVNVKNYEDVGIGDDRLSAIRNYLMKVGKNRGNAGSNGTILAEIEIITSLTRFNSEVNGGNTIYYFTINEKKNQFLGNSSTSTELCLSRVGDKVKIRYFEAEGEIQVTFFDNLSIDLNASEVNEVISASNDSITKVNLAPVQEKVADKEWNKLTAKQKQELLKKTK